MDAVQRADSGHPGTAMALAPSRTCLWQRHLAIQSRDPRLVAGATASLLSAGMPACCCTRSSTSPGTNLSLDDIKQFRQWGSRTPGHSEHGLTPGVEATTGPLGQGVGTPSGWRSRRRTLAQLFNRPGHTVVDHCTYFLASDGDLMEGVVDEACSLGRPSEARPV